MVTSFSFIRELTVSTFDQRLRSIFSENAPAWSSCKRKGGRPMSSLPIRQDLRDLFAHCERLLASALAPTHAPFSQDERQMICY
jgi:hypothetical protein